jgi:O-antigen biosynthesis protein
MNPANAQGGISRVAELLRIGPELFWEPIRLVLPGAWAGHIPFALWLIKTMKPDTFVELGTHSGNSYAAFCQACALCGLPTRAFAVNTWRGDAHSGLYDESAFTDLSAFNSVHFGRFSQLLRTTFDEARPCFAANAIDLLHIDGPHTDEAVRHDFETWRDALSSRAVVVFHDINVRECGFGAWRLWEELAAQYPSFAFDHSQGLGVLGVGPEQPLPLQNLFRLGSASEAAAMTRTLFASRGEVLQRRLQVAACEQRLPVVTGEAAQAQERLAVAAATQERLAAETARAQALHERALAAEARIATAEQQVSHLRAELKAAGEAGRGESRRQRDEISRLVAERETLQAAHQRSLHRAEAAGWEAAATFYQNTTSWRVTAPLRAAILALRGRGIHLQPPRLRAPAPAAQPTPTGGGTPAATGTMDHRAALRMMLANRLAAFLAGSGTLVLPQAAEPDVSIILVLYNQAELTFGCLSSIVECLGTHGGVEVVILDNASTDATDRLLERVSGARVVHSPENLHFLRGVNRAVREARGRNILLFNNDAQLLPGTLEAALRTLRSAPGIGAVGGRVVLPDGTLQEAGSILWNDGTATGYGRGHAPTEPAFDFRRDVDYCSGVFLLTPREIFQRLGGFDERYAPAYYEETDYCVRLQQAGLRVVFDPDAVVLHYEFGSSAGSEAALALQQRNHAIFLRRHADWLAQRPAPGRVLAGRSRPRGPRVLVVDDRVPHPWLGSGYPRARDLLHQLVAAGAEVTLYPMFAQLETRERLRATLDPGIEVMLGHDSSSLRDFLAERRNHYDAVLVCRPHNMRRFRAAIGEDRAQLGDAVLLYDAEAIFSLREITQSRLTDKPVSEERARQMVADEIALTAGVDAVLAVSAGEKQIFEAHGAGPVHVLGHAIAPEPGTRPFAERDGFLFVGALQSDDSPNADSLRWFAAEVLPRLRNVFGDPLRLQVVGQCQAPSVRALDGEAIDLLGRVEDLRPIFDKVRVMVAPTRFGGGVPHKVHQAAAYGVPVVATALIAAQLGWQDGHDLLVASSAENFAEACIRLHCDEALWTRIRQNALDRCTTECAPDAFRQGVRAILDMIPGRRRAAEGLWPHG